MIQSQLPFRRATKLRLTRADNVNTGTVGIDFHRETKSDGTPLAMSVQESPPFSVLYKPSGSAKHALRIGRVTDDLMNALSPFRILLTLRQKLLRPGCEAASFRHHRQFDKRRQSRWR